ncbi:Methionine_gamma-lyase [Hexamita inflata]|uniref:Methionine gamma-lyase n=1 Tax=Hexamita inflata TaxID=28002 RepID=A0AA86P6P9_9EUKA|nr:Methionine gamma-lyase [Hexamita inflata]
MSEMHPTTQCIHGGYNPGEHNHAANVPIYLTSTFEFDSAEACAKAFAGEPEPGQTHFYSRMSNPTNEILEKRLALLEHADAAAVFGSGMGAIAGVFWTFLKQGSVIISSNRVYGCTHALLSHQLTKFGVTVEFVDFTDLKKVEEVCAKYPEISMIYGETVQNPSNDIIDIEALSKISKAHHSKLVIDNTFATPLGCNPLDFGADIVIHSATKYLIGGLCIAGCVMGSFADIAQIKSVGLKDCTGAVLDPVAAFMMLNQIETLDLRVRCMSDNATKLALFLQNHKKIKTVIATGLESHPQFELCKKYLRIPNGLITIYVNGGFNECCQIMNKFKLALRAVSLGKTHTLVNHPASMTHSSYTDDEKAESGISQNMIRISVGCEDISDIIKDFEQALEETNWKAQKKDSQ